MDFKKDLEICNCGIKNDSLDWINNSEKILSALLEEEEEEESVTYKEGPAQPLPLALPPSLSPPVPKAIAGFLPQFFSK